MSPKLRILGIDPGISVTGYGVIDYQADRPRLVECGIIKTKVKDSQGERLHQLYQGVNQLLKKFKPKTLAIEDSFLGKNFKAAKVLGGAKAVVLLAGAERKLATREFSPREVKQAVVGRGEASKEQVNFMVTNLLRLKSLPVKEDTSDALAVALCCAFRTNSESGKSLS